MGASIRPTWAGGVPATRARYVFLTRRARSWAISAACASSLRATMIRPLVSRSSRCTMPVRSAPPICPYASAPPRASNALTSVPERWPGRGMGDQAGGLVDDQHPGILVDDAQRHRPAASTLAGSRGGTSSSSVGARIEHRIALDRPAIERQAAFLDQPLDVAARKAARRRQRRGLRAQRGGRQARSPSRRSDISPRVPPGGASAGRRRAPAG